MSIISCLHLAAAVYGFAEGDARNEQAPLNPLTAYAKSKNRYGK